MRLQIWLALGLTLLLGSRVEARGPWLQWNDCRLEENDANDGDSFHVKAGGEKYIIRLYLVDAPESDDGFPERVAEQAKYFGITSAQSVQLGELAAKFVQEKLARPFTVQTAKQSAMGRSSALRYYGFVTTSEGDLGELLVANGLARVHGFAPAADETHPLPSDGPKLKRLEMQARTAQVGGWGASAGRMSARVGAPGTQRKLDPFDKFFHPERAVTKPTSHTVIASAPVPSATPTTVPSTASEKLDVNAATLAELIKLKGIGPVLAGRIIAARPFKSADDLRRVKGIGRKKYEQIRPQFAL